MRILSRSEWAWHALARSPAGVKGQPRKVHEYDRHSFTRDRMTAFREGDTNDHSSGALRIFPEGELDRRAGRSFSASITRRHLHDLRFRHHHWRMVDDTREDVLRWLVVLPRVGTTGCFWPFPDIHQAGRCTTRDLDRKRLTFPRKHSQNPL